MLRAYHAVAPFSKKGSAVISAFQSANVSYRLLGILFEQRFDDGKKF